jgi:8-oxo-dGTP pyrophosphatase MutT (NUDIX family)
MRAVREVSAGGVIYRKHGGAIEIALIHVRHRWGLPKGHVEEGESIDETAIREVREETGLEGRVRKKLGDIRYSYREKRKGGEPVRIYKRVYFYLLRYIRGDVRDHDHEVEEARWFPISEAMNVLKFATERRMVQRALAVLTAAERRLARAASDEQR